MSHIILYLYCFFLLLFSIGALFILYHLLRYSLDKTLGLMGALFFSIVFCILIITNITAFRSLDLTEVLQGARADILLPQSQFAPSLNTRSTNPW